MFGRIFRRASGERGWIDYLFDFGVVVVGVFLGLQAQSWAERNSDRAQETRFLEQLGTDFEAIITDARICLRIYERAGQAVSRVRNALDAPAAGEGFSPDIENDLITMTAGRLPPGRSASYVEMISSGELGLIRSDPLRAALVRYDEIAVSNRDNWRAIRQESARLLPSLYRHIALVAAAPDEGLSLSSVNAPALAAEPDFHALLNALAGGAVNVEALCAQQMDRANRVRDLLD